MNLKFNETYSEYHSNSQKARVLTENWVLENMYCPRCGNSYIEKYENNRPVADFFCPRCHNEYELKSKIGSLSHKINDGAYSTMIERITSNNNPDFFFMNYSKSELEVKDFMLIPKHFFTPTIIEKRNPLSQTARRAGWIGCNILIDKIPVQGRVQIVEHGNICERNSVIKKVYTGNILETNNMDSRKWLMDVLNCVNKINSLFFTLSDIYSFGDELKLMHPNNNNINPKIRQQLQFLRDRGFVEFLGNGKYRKVL